MITASIVGVPLVEFMYLIFTRMPGTVNVGDSGLCSASGTSFELQSTSLFVDNVTCSKRAHSKRLLLSGP